MLHGNFQPGLNLEHKHQKAVYPSNPPPHTHTHTDACQTGKKKTVLFSSSPLPTPFRKHRGHLHFSSLFPGCALGPAHSFESRSVCGCDLSKKLIGRPSTVLLSTFPLFPRLRSRLLTEYESVVLDRDHTESTWILELLVTG